MKRYVFVTSVLALSVSALSPLAALADDFDLHVGDGGVSVGIDIGTAPPPAQVEVVPAPREGYVWAPGYWAWDGHRHNWVKGRWVQERAGYGYVPGRWEQRGGRWHFEPEHWEARHAEERRHEEERADHRHEDRERHENDRDYRRDRNE